MYRGRPLEGTVKLEEQGVRTGATIHVMRRNGSLPEEDCSSSDQAPLTDDKLREITSAFKRFTASRLWVGAVEHAQNWNLITPIPLPGTLASPSSLSHIEAVPGDKG